MYSYSEMKHEVFTEEGYRKLNQIKQNMKDRDVFTVEEITKGICGDSWSTLACVDWLVENNELQYINTDGWKQHHVLRRVR